MRWTVFAAALGVLVPSIALAADPPGSSDSLQAASPADENSEVDRAISIPSEARGGLPRRGLSQPLLGRGIVSVGFGPSAFNSSVPIGTTAGVFRGRANETALTLEVVGRRVAFNLDAAASMGSMAPTADGIVPASRATSLQARSSVGKMFSAEGASITAGFGVELRANAIGSLEEADQFLTNWQSAIPGADIHARVYLNQRISLAGSAFAGFSPVAGEWVSMDVAGNGHEHTGSLTNASVLAGTVSAAMHLNERFAMSAGVAGRDAGFQLGGHAHLHEHAVRPFVALDVLY